METGHSGNPYALNSLFPQSCDCPGNHNASFPFWNIYRNCFFKEDVANGMAGDQ
jgi:hypothetical protein